MTNGGDIKVDMTVMCLLSLDFQRFKFSRPESCWIIFVFYPFGCASLLLSQKPYPLRWARPSLTQL